MERSKLVQFEHPPVTLPARAGRPVRNTVHVRVRVPQECSVGIHLAR